MESTSGSTSSEARLEAYEMIGPSDAGEQVGVFGGVKVRPVDPSTLKGDKAQKLHDSGRLFFLETVGKTQRVVVSEQGLKRLQQYGVNPEKMVVQVEGEGLRTWTVKKDKRDLFNKLFKPALKRLQQTRKRQEKTEEGGDGRAEVQSAQKDSSRLASQLAYRRIEQDAAVEEKKATDTSRLIPKLRKALVDTLVTTEVIETNKKEREKQAKQRKERLEEREEGRTLKKEERKRPTATQKVRKSKVIGTNEQWINRERRVASERKKRD